MASPVVRVGVAAVIQDNKGNVILGVRKGSHGSGTWQFPGGHLEVGESWFACAERETLEETGLVVKAERFFAATNDVFEEGKHYITLFILCKRVDESAEPEVLEPHKCESWSWKSWSDVRGLTEGDEQKVFLPIVNLFKDHPDIESRVLV
ncbi:Nudix hydrolase 1 [Podospora fimiseda]|uniref:Nudix hydrolase 1 n=1 Tax=Podospora fimiseda TaxID=252190 RepID=A0AAN7BXX6_9PEZI|nr:Nudix hydrolase 1 [Podospora fimiseda]